MINRQLVCALTLALFSSSSLAEDIYSWKSAEGVVHYSSKPQPGAKKADLPKITKEAVATKVGLKSCDKHGGINCSAGADTDGSVMCRDGFKDAAARYAFTCQSARLEFVESAFDPKNGEYKVYVRNSKPVPAKRVAVIYQEKLFAPTKLSGPSEIAPYETGEFSLQNKPGMEFQKPTAKSLVIACNNCG